MRIPDPTHRKVRLKTMKSFELSMLSPGKKKRKKEPSTIPTPTPISSMWSPEKKKMKKEPSTTPQLSTLPYDLLLNCIARVSRLYYPTLSLVSKSFRSLIASHELYKVRSLLSHTESCLYLCLDVFAHRNPTWFTLCRKPDQTLTNEETGKKKKKSSGYVLARVPILNSPYAVDAGLVAVGSNIYNIGGASLSSMYTGSYSSVSILDCRSHTWSVAPSLQVELMSLSASVLDQKIYVAGRYDPNPKMEYGTYLYDDSCCKTSVQVFDTKTQIWDSLAIGTQDTSICYDTAPISDALSIDGKFLLVTNKGVVAYDSKEDRWNAVGEWTGFDSVLGCCVIDNVTYCLSHGDGVFKWYDGERKWRNLKGLVGLPKLNLTAHNVKLADYGGKMAVLWWGGEDVPLFSDEEIWCAEIALERRNSCEIWGKLEWFDHVLTVHGGSDCLSFLAATV